MSSDPETPNQSVPTSGQPINGAQEPVAAKVPPLIGFDEFENYAKRFLSTLSAPSSKKPSANQGNSGDKGTAPASQGNTKPVVSSQSNRVSVTHHNVELSITKTSDNSAVVTVNGHDKNLETLLQFFKSMAENRKKDESERVAFEITEPQSLTEKQLRDLLNTIQYSQDLLQYVEIRLNGRSLLLTQDSVTEITNKIENKNSVEVATIPKGLHQYSEDSDSDDGVEIIETSENNLEVKQEGSGDPKVTSHPEGVPASLSEQNASTNAATDITGPSSIPEVNRLSDAMSQPKTPPRRVTVEEIPAPTPAHMAAAAPNKAPSTENTAPVTTPPPVTASTNSQGAPLNSQEAPFSSHRTVTLQENPVAPTANNNPNSAPTKPIQVTETVTHPRNSQNLFGFFSACLGKKSEGDTPVIDPKPNGTP